ncbi:MAG: hypothetical protein KatS3mg129_1121 [Leptospiraceae bacterium]|nr:MAG: hypothetical protein KatS3mg129_1121 [Leptospiraceae bacterium]
MSIFGKLDDFLSDKEKKKKSKNEHSDSDKKIDLPDITNADILEELHAKPLIEGKIGDKTYIFGKYSEQEIYELMDWSGVFEKIRRKGYEDFNLELQYLSEMDQRIFVKWQEEVLIHIRLKLSHFRFRFTPGAPSRKLLYIDWLMTRDPKRKDQLKKPLFQGQDAPGLGIFNEVADFVFNLALGLGVKGAFNIPEYFHDAVLFHRQFRFYDPQREAFFRALIRDLRKYGARAISEAFSENRIYDQDNQVVQWIPGEMISLIDPDFSDFVWNKDYFMKVVRYLKRFSFRIEEKKD